MGVMGGLAAVEAAPKILGTGPEAMRLVLWLVYLANRKYGIPVGQALGAVMEWAHLCQRHGATWILNWRLETGRGLNRHERKLQTQRRVYWHRRQNGLCVDCGRLAEAGKVRCRECYERTHEYKRRYRQKQARREEERAV